MIFNKVKGHNRIKNAYRHRILLSAVSCYLAIIAYPAMAHHMIDNQLPASFFEGFVSGLAHPIIGFDHLIFICSIGLLAAIRIKQRGWVLPPAYVVATLFGTVTFLPSPFWAMLEIFVAGSVVLIGFLVIFAKDRGTQNWGILFSIFAGLLHGYAYGESIIGAENTPLLAYLLGLSVIQILIAAVVYLSLKTAVSRYETKKVSRTIRHAGLVVGSFGMFFLTTALSNFLS